MNVSDAASYLSASSSASSSGLPTSSAVVDNSLFPFLPRWLKLAVVVLFVLNARSWPGVWHAGVWYHAVRAQVRAHVFTGVLPHLRDMLASNGADPFKLKSVRSLWAGPDDCDFNLHLSNSCYAKHCDASRMKAIVDWFGPFLVAGGWCGLAGGSYVFPREIKALATYDVEFTIGGFGSKFIYLVGTFVGGPDTRSSSSAASYSPKLDNAGFRASLAQSKEYLGMPPSPTSLTGSGVVTPLPRREDGRIVHCVSVSQYCFKLGRLTIPPAVVFAFCGYGARSNWERFEMLYSDGPRAMRAWLRDGWKADDAHLEFDAEGRQKGRKGEDMRELLAAFGPQ